MLQEYRLNLKATYKYHEAFTFFTVCSHSPITFIVSGSDKLPSLIHRLLTVGVNTHSFLAHNLGMLIQRNLRIVTNLEPVGNLSPRHWLAFMLQIIHTEEFAIQDYKFT